MKPHVERQIEALKDMTVHELRQRYAEVFREETRSRHKTFLVKRITWQLQANDEGGLSERARRRAQELASEGDLRLIAPKGDRTSPGRTVIGRLSPTHDRRLPMPGAVITREYKGRTITVTVLDNGFEYQGEIYRSLSAVAKVVSGSHWNGYVFFRLGKKKDRK